MATRIEGLEALIAKIDTVAKLGAVRGALMAGGAHLKTKMQVYPPVSRPTRASVYGQTFQSDRQRRFFFWALKAGKIGVPYRRGGSPGSRNLKQNWTVIASNNGLTVEIANATPYGPLVQGAGSQSRYMAAVGWQTDEEVTGREGPAVVQYVKQAIDEALG